MMKLIKPVTALFQSALIVDDEPLLRMDAADMVAEQGYAIIEASSGDQALEILNGAHDINLVFTDIQMPGKIDGLQLADLVAERWPEICVIVTSGAVRPGAGAIPDKAAFISKPYSPATVHKAIATVCETSS